MKSAWLRLCLGLACLVWYGAAAQTKTSSSGAAPSDAEIRGVLAERIDVQKQGVGIVVGIIDPERLDQFRGFHDAGSRHE